jgi:hypothetical protein
VVHFTAIVPKDYSFSFLANRLGPIMRFDRKADFFNIMKSVEFISCIMAGSSVILVFS